MAVPEMVAVLFAVLYLVLAIRQNILCWYCAGISTAIFVYVYYGANLYMESLLNVFYFAMAIYGWHSWRSGGSDDDAMRVSIWPATRHALAISVIIIVSAVSGAWLSAYTDAALPYIDSATTFAAIWATFLVTRKVLENWWYWLVIDVVSVFIYWSRGLELTAILFLFYVVLIPVGLLSWTRSYRASLPAAEAAA
jgi:nicotinamide mononucleotide transporter